MDPLMDSFGVVDVPDDTASSAPEPDLPLLPPHSTTLQQQQLQKQQDNSNHPHLPPFPLEEDVDECQYGDPPEDGSSASATATAASLIIAQAAAAAVVEGVSQVDVGAVVDAVEAAVSASNTSTSVAPSRLPPPRRRQQQQKQQQPYHRQQMEIRSIKNKAIAAEPTLPNSIGGLGLEVPMQQAHTLHPGMVSVGVGRDPLALDHTTSSGSSSSLNLRDHHEGIVGIVAAADNMNQVSVKQQDAQRRKRYKEKKTDEGSLVVAAAAAAAVAAANAAAGASTSSTTEGASVARSVEGAFFSGMDDGGDDEEGPVSGIFDPNRSSTTANSSSSPSPRKRSREEALAARRSKDRVRYASMSPEQRQMYNNKRREQYHKQSEVSRQKRRERERMRYHSLQNEAATDRNIRRARLERERYQKLGPEELEEKNRKRRQRAAALRSKKEHFNRHHQALGVVDSAGSVAESVGSLITEHTQVGDERDRQAELANETIQALVPKVEDFVEFVDV